MVIWYVVSVRRVFIWILNKKSCFYWLTFALGVLILVLKERGTNMTRNDVHRPSVVKTEDYDCVSFHSHDNLDFAANLMEQQAFRQHMQAHPGSKFSTHSHGGSCHVCGAYAMTVARFYHRPTNTYVEVGSTCMDKMFGGDPKAFQHFKKAGRDARKLAAGKAKAQATLTDRGLDRVWELYLEWRAQDVEYEYRVQGYMLTLADVVSKLVRYGSLTEKQFAFLETLVDQVDHAAERAAAQKAEHDAAADVPVSVERVTVKGEVVSTKWQDGYYGEQFKMLVKHAKGWKVWGTVPSSLSPERGDKVKFDALVKVSKDDPKFGFFSRPTKAEVLV